MQVSCLHPETQEVGMNLSLVTATTHAATRCQQRGVKNEIVNLILSEADLIKNCKNGATSMLISTKRLQKLVKQKICEPCLAEKANGVIIIDSGGSIITVFHKKQRFYV